MPEERRRDILDSVSERPEPKIQTSITINRVDGSVFQTVASTVESEIIEGSLEGIENLARLNCPPVGHCIYCRGTDNLSKEHIIPYGLNGNAVLSAASCARCRNITASFEREVLRGSMRAVRVGLKFQSRKKHHGAPLTEPLMFTRNGVSETIDLPIERFPIRLPFPKFAPPQFLAGDQNSKLKIIGATTILFGPRPEVVGKELGAQKLVFQSRRDSPVSFARMIAKIGYAMASHRDSPRQRSATPCFRSSAIQQFGGSNLRSHTRTPQIRRFLANPSEQRWRDSFPRAWNGLRSATLRCKMRLAASQTSSFVKFRQNRSDVSYARLFSVGLGRASFCIFARLENSRSIKRRSLL